VNQKAQDRLLRRVIAVAKPNIHDRGANDFADERDLGRRADWGVGEDVLVRNLNPNGRFLQAPQSGTVHNQVDRALGIDEFFDVLVDLL